MRSNFENNKLCFLLSKHESICASRLADEKVGPSDCLQLAYAATQCRIRWKAREEGK